MSDPVSADHPEAPVASPCINLCRMDPATGLCLGCLRTLDEIAAWSGLSADAKRAIWRTLATRRPCLQRENSRPEQAD